MNLRLLKRYIHQTILESSDEPRIVDQPFDPDDLEPDGEIKDSEKEKYSFNDDESQNLRDNNYSVDEFSAAGGGAIMGHVGSTQVNKKENN